MVRAAASILAVPVVFLVGLFSSCAGQETGPPSYTRAVGTRVETGRVVPLVGPTGSTITTLPIPNEILTSLPPAKITTGPRP
jgi:hypothetical protein